MKQQNRLFRISTLYLLLVAFIISFTSCDPEAKPFVLNKEEIKFSQQGETLEAEIGKPFTIVVTAPNETGITYEWTLDKEVISNTKDLSYEFKNAGLYDLRLTVKYNETFFTYDWKVKTTYGTATLTPTEGATAYITKVLDYRPSIGQFTNKLPPYEEGNTQEDMNQKVLNAIGNNKRGMITLGGYGGYVVVGFDHTIENKPGLRDILFEGNGFEGSSEPGIIMVAYDANKNGVPDPEEWYEIAGSAHRDHTKETWYEQAKEAGNNVNCYLYDYEVTFFKPAKEPDTKDAKAMAQYVSWEDNKGNKGYMEKNNWHKQPYYPLWIKEDKLTFKGTRLPQNGINTGTATRPYFKLFSFKYGYVDNLGNADKKGSSIDIDWAVNSKGQSVKLPGVDFVKIYTGVLQTNGWLGECSTEVTNVIDLHIKGEKIATE